MEQLSVFDIFKIGVGPSSSHTMGPWRACRQCMQDLDAQGLLGDVDAVQVVLFGSLAKTGRGHGTLRAVMLGLSGFDPVTVDVSLLSEIVGKIRDGQRLRLLDRHEIPFDPSVDIILRGTERRPFHANALDVVIAFKDGSRRTETFYSVGGGFVVKDGEEPNESEVNLPYPIESGADLERYCSESGRAIGAVVRENERQWRSDEDIDAGLMRIWQAMKNCVYKGCHTEGILPGGLEVGRRAPRMAAKLLGEAEYGDADEWIAAIRGKGRAFRDVTNWVSCFALATNEENASFGRIVTAPTNGAAGVVPAVLMYYVCFDDGTDADAIDFLLTAGQIGMLFKQGATLSAAMGGCQAEIGVSSAMASAALTALRSGTYEQAIMAAEIAMEHHLGLTCDPVGGLVQIPCIERNSMGAIKAITASNIALESDPTAAKVSLDAVIRSMWDTARDMNEKYKETSEGGLATHIPVSVVEC